MRCAVRLRILGRLSKPIDHARVSIAGAGTCRRVGDEAGGAQANRGWKNLNGE